MLLNDERSAAAAASAQPTRFPLPSRRQICGSLPRRSKRNYPMDPRRAHIYSQPILTKPRRLLAGRSSSLNPLLLLLLASSSLLTAPYDAVPVLSSPSPSPSSSSSLSEPELASPLSGPSSSPKSPAAAAAAGASIWRMRLRGPCRIPAAAAGPITPPSTAAPVTVIIIISVAITSR